MSYLSVSGSLMFRQLLHRSLTLPCLSISRRCGLCGGARDVPGIVRLFVRAVLSLFSLLRFRFEVRAVQLTADTEQSRRFLESIRDRTFGDHVLARSFECLNSDMLAR